METEYVNFNEQEYKRKFRWKLEIDGLPSFVMKSTRRPTFCSGAQPGLEAVLYDLISPSSSKLLWDWWQSKEKRNASLKLLDPHGSVIEQWNYVGVELYYIDFGIIEYGSADPIEIHISAIFETVELVI